MKIMIAVDGSAASLDAVRHAIALLREGLRASLLLVNVQEPTHLYEMVLARDLALIERAAQDAGAHALREAVALVQAAALQPQTQIATGEPAHMLVEVAENFGCTMIVVGARGAGSLRSAMLGSVSTELLHSASMPVLVVKTAPASAEAEFEAEADAA